MTERKREWLESEEFKRLLIGFDELDVDYDDVIDFIRARIEEERKSDREEIIRLRGELRSQADWCDRYEQFTSIHDDGEERLYAAQCAREMRQALEQSAPEEVKNETRP